MTAAEISRKWVKALGLAWHPDTPGADYRHFDASLIAEYDADMAALFTQAAYANDDPYAIALKAMEASSEWQNMTFDAIAKAPTKRTPDEWRAIDIAKGRAL